MLTLVIAAGGVALVVVNIFRRVRAADFPALMLKTGCGVMFILTAAAALVTTREALSMPNLLLGMTVVLGLFFGLLGDVWLGVKELARPEHYDGYFKAGFGSFGLGHLCFVAGMLLVYRPGWLSIAGSVLLATIIPAVLVFGAKWLRLDFGDFKWIAAGYGFLLCWTTAVGFISAYLGTQPGAIAAYSCCYPILQPELMGIGGAAFLVSDLILAAVYFGGLNDSRWAHAGCYIFYYGAQFTIALSLLALV
ncbi:MAG: lysoplasmalogenase [Propionibacteriaceae bacterium]|jgi:hypothetical protein|nr:lysoplasmalogenase [Propionibacteriaceae bacterium]